MLEILKLSLKKPSNISRLIGYVRETSLFMHIYDILYIPSFSVMSNFVNFATKYRCSLFYSDSFYCFSHTVVLN